jgi:hypothetical protein
MLWGAAFVLGLLALGAPMVFASDARPATAGIIALLFTAFLAFGVCGNMLGGELAERRLSFYFTRPLSAGAIFAGKLAAAALLAFGGQILIWSPTMIAGDQLRDLTLPFAAILSALTPLLLALGFVAGIVARCRSRWLLASAALAVLMLALVAFLAVEGVLVWELGWLSRAGGIALFGGTMGGITLALLAGVAAAVAYGRTDPVRAHGALTIVAALALVPIGSAALAASHRALRPRLTDVVSVHVAEAAPTGGWVYVSGSVLDDRSGWQPDFLFNPQTARSQRIGWLASDLEPAFSFDGTHAAWVELKSIYDAVAGKDPTFAEVTLVARDLSEQTEVRTDVAINRVRGVGWSPDGRFIAIVGEKEAQLRRSDTLHLVAEAKARTGTMWRRAVFATSTRLRLFAGDEGGADVVDLRADTRSSADVAHLDTKGILLDLEVSPDGERVLAQEPDGAVRLWSVGGGAPITLETLPPKAFCGGFLRDGRVAIGHGSVQGRPETAVTARVHVYSREGQRQRAIDLGFGTASCVFDGNRLLVAVNPRPNPRQDQQQLWLVDADQGTARALDARLRILMRLPGVVERPFAGQLLVGDVHGSLVAIDPSTDKPQMLVPGRVQ